MSQPLPFSAAAALNSSCVVVVFGNDRLRARAPCRARLRSFWCNSADSDEVAWAIRDDVARDYEMMSPGFGARWHQYFWQQLVASQAWFGQRSVASVSARRVDGEEIVEIEISNRLQRLAGGSVVQGGGQYLEPLRVFGL